MIINVVLVPFVPGGPIEQILAEMEGRGDVFKSIAGAGGAEAGGGAEATDFGFFANRAHEVREAVLRSSRPEDIRPPLLLINRLQAWFSPALVVLGRTRTSSGPAVPPETRRLARSIMRAGLQRHRRPTWGGLHPHIDQRQAELERLAPGEAGGGHAGLWLDLRGLRPRLNRRGQPTRQQAVLRLPLRAYADHAARVGQGGTTALTVQRIERPAARAESVTHRLPDGTACPTGVRASSSWAWCPT